MNLFRKQKTETSDNLETKATKYLDTHYTRNTHDVNTIPKGYILEPDSINGIAKVECIPSDILRKEDANFNPGYNIGDILGCNVTKTYTRKSDNKKEINLWNFMYNKSKPVIWTRRGNRYFAGESASKVRFGGKKKRKTKTKTKTKKRT